MLTLTKPLTKKAALTLIHALTLKIEQEIANEMVTSLICQTTGCTNLATYQEDRCHLCQLAFDMQCLFG